MAKNDAKETCDCHSPYNVRSSVSVTEEGRPAPENETTQSRVRHIRNKKRLDMSLGHFVVHQLTIDEPDDVMLYYRNVPIIEVLIHDEI